MSAPLVSCIMPTGRRLSRLPQALRLFAAQDYPHKELVVVDDGEESAEAACSGWRETVRFIRLRERVTIGEARNIACDAALGSVIVHMDDDDWHAPWRLRYQASLLQGATRVVGNRNLTYLDSSTGKVWRYRYFMPDAWVSGHSFAYLKDAWRALAFPNKQIGEDTEWVRRQPRDTVLAAPREDFVIGIIHDANTCRKQLDNAVWSEAPDPAQFIPAAMIPDLPFYLDRMQRR